MYAVLYSVWRVRTLYAYTVSDIVSISVFESISESVFESNFVFESIFESVFVFESDFVFVFDMVGVGGVEGWFARRGLRGVVAVVARRCGRGVACAAWFRAARGCGGERVVVASRALLRASVLTRVYARFARVERVWGHVWGLKRANPLYRMVRWVDRFVYAESGQMVLQAVLQWCGLGSTT